MPPIVWYALGFLVGMAVYAIGLRLACYLAEVPVPGFFIACGVGLAALALLGLVSWGVAAVLGVGPVGPTEGLNRTPARVALVPAFLAALVGLYALALSIRLRRAVRVLFTQLLHLSLFALGYGVFILVQKLVA